MDVMFSQVLVSNNQESVSFANTGLKFGVVVRVNLKTHCPLKSKRLIEIFVEMFGLQVCHSFKET